MEKPEALRLADALETGDIHENAWQAAAELRRLHAENEALRGERTKLDGWWQDALQAAGRWERQFYKTKAQRDALLEALRDLVQNEGLDPYSYLDKGIGTATASGRRWLNARAAIKAVEGEKK